MENLKIDTSQNVSLEYQVAGIGERILAKLADIIIKMVMIIVLLLMLGSLGLRSSGFSIGTFIYIFFIILYDLLFEIFMNGRTPGKMWMSIQVVKIDGSSASFSSYLIRWLIGLFEFYVTLGLVPVLVIIIAGKGQRFGDIIAKTTLVKYGEQAEISETIFQDNDPDYEIRFKEISKLNDDDINLVKEIVERLNEDLIESKIKDIARKARNKIESKINENYEKGDLEFFQTILKDYNHYFGKI